MQHHRSWAERLFLVTILGMLGAQAASAQDELEGATPEGATPEGATPEGATPETASEPLEAVPEPSPPAEVDALPAPVQPMEAPTCAGRARAVALDAVVRVRSGNSWGAGFVYPTPRHVVTAFGLVAQGRPVSVVTRSGARVEGRVVARDEAFGLAVVELTEDLPGATPLAPAPETSALVGQPVVAMGHPTDTLRFALGDRAEGLLRWSVSEGRVGAVGDEGIQADLTLRPGHAGAPLLDCEGRALGVVGAGGIGPGIVLAARTAVVDAAMREAEPGEFLGDLRLRFGIGALLYVDDGGRVAGGGYLTLGATLFDRLSWMNRVGLLAGFNEPTEAADLSVDRRLIRVESLLGWRFFVDVGGFTTLHIVPAIGVSVVHAMQTRRSVGIEPVPGCVPSEADACVQPRITETSSSSWHARPAAGLTFIVGGGLELAYTFELDLEDPVTTFHAAHLGLQF